MEKTGCKIICGARTTLAVKGLLMLMLMILLLNADLASPFTNEYKSDHAKLSRGGQWRGLNSQEVAGKSKKKTGALFKVKGGPEDRKAS